jgi:folate-binding protein YgfZ
MKCNASASPGAQYESFQSGRGFIELTNWTSIAVSGTDRQPFLHNFCTSDIKRLTTGESCEAFFTNVKGKIVGHGLVHCRANELVVIGEPHQAPRLIEHLDRYIIREDVQLHDHTAAHAYLLIAGQPSPTQVHDLVVHLTDWYKANGLSFQLIETAASDVPKLKEKLASKQFMACDEVFEIVRIEAGIPLFDVDFDDRNLPQEVGRDAEAISFTKGCYLGQETVARIDALGHVNQRLVGVRFNGEIVPDKGIELTHAGKTAGHVSSAAFSPKLEAPLALAMLRREHGHAGARLDSPSGACEVVAIPV